MATGDLAVEVRELRKSYRTRRTRRPAVAGLDLSVPSGGVHGFLGPNGSGKTTTIRMLLGLISAESGSMRIFGTEVPTGLDQVVDRIGAIVEQPRFFPAFSGRKNLLLLARAIKAPRFRVTEVLDEVGLGDRAGDRFSRYSLGMKQRLAIAATLLKDPDLLIFDEPTNGLDPAGIHEIRATMRGLADRGKTVLVSSHILSEVAQIADTVSIIGRGRLLAEGPVDQILANSTGAAVRVGVADPDRATRLLVDGGYRVAGSADHLLTVSLGGTGAGTPGADGFDPSRITELLARSGLYVHELTPVRTDLESVFLDLTAEEHLGAQRPDSDRSVPMPVPTGRPQPARPEQVAPRRARKDDAS
jgi:ABC-2 type transport system ATP-binding protein